MTAITIYLAPEDIAELRRIAADDTAALRASDPEHPACSVESTVAAIVVTELQRRRRARAARQGGPI